MGFPLVPHFSQVFIEWFGTQEDSDPKGNRTPGRKVESLAFLPTETTGPRGAFVIVTKALKNAVAVLTLAIQGFCGL